MESEISWLQGKTESDKLELSPWFHFSMEISGWSRDCHEDQEIWDLAEELNKVAMWTWTCEITSSLSFVLFSCTL